MTADDREAAVAVEYVDTHAHLDEAAFDDDRAEVIARARAAGVRRIVNIGYRPDRWPSSASLAAKFPEVCFSTTVGVHPQDAALLTDTAADEMEAAIDTLRPVAIGEIGLDFYWEPYDVEVQRRAFVRQLEIARNHRLPVVIHQRAAEAICAEVLAEHARDISIVLHSFDGTDILGELAAERGYVLGVGGLMTRRSARTVRAIVSRTPLDRLVLETDSPYLVPAGVKARRNEPANLPLVAARLAELIGTDVAAVAAGTTATARRIFG